MGKIAFFNISATGHVNPSLNLVRELIARGETVYYFNAEEMRGLVETSGATFVPYPDPETLPELGDALARTESGHLSDNALGFHEMTFAYLPFVLAWIDREKPDCVVHDSVAAWGMYAAEFRGIPAVGCFTTFVLTPKTIPRVGFKNSFTMGLEVLPTLPGFLRVKKKMKHAFDVELDHPMSSMAAASDQNLVFTVEALQPNRHVLSEKFHFIGASIGGRPPGEFPFDQLTGQPLITISLGTIYNHNLDFYRSCFEALGSEECQVVLAVGKKTELEELGPIPDNFIVRQFVPQLPLLERSDLFVTHAGMNSAHEALWFGVPMVAIPQQLEQAIVARQVEAAGAGIALATSPPIGRVTTAELRDAVKTVLRNRGPYQDAAKKLGQTLRDAGGASKGATIIVEAARSPGNRPPISG